jgi:3-keto-5-aminohexanoate cleavage enzyme
LSASPSPFPFPAHPLTAYPPLIVNVALTGMVARRARVPHVPVTSEQIVADAERCFEAGATIFHLHARDADERPTWRREAYAETIVELRRRCPGAVVCATTSGRDGADVDQRADVLQLDGEARPDMASLTLGSLNFRDGPSVNAIATVEELARRMAAAGIQPELELFDLGMAHLAHRLLDRGLIAQPLYANVMLGFPNGMPADVRALAALLGSLPAQTVWAAAGLGAFQRPANALAIAAGGHVRTGLEDNPHLDHVTRTPATNLQLVERAAQLAAAVGRPLATPAQTRAALGLPLSAPAPAPAPLDPTNLVESTI